MNRFDTRFGPDAKSPAARMRVRLIAAASITTGLVAGFVVAGGGLSGVLHAPIAQHLAKSAASSVAISAAALFPTPVQHPASSGLYVAYVAPPVSKPSQPADTKDERPPAGPATQPQAGGSDTGGAGGGGDN